MRINPIKTKPNSFKKKIMYINNKININVCQTDSVTTTAWIIILHIL